MTSYRVRERAPYSVRQALAAHPELLQDLLYFREITDPVLADKFLRPSFEEDSHDPFLMPDMERAVERILSAARTNEKAAVWSDYDCDGIPGGVMLSGFLRETGLYVRHYIPHRHEEGYGLNLQGIDELAGEGVTLVITVDLGTTDKEVIAHAKEKGIDVIVTDHHIVPDASHLPDAFALLNPKRPDSRYPFPHLCGSGVAWKLVQAILSKKRPEGFAEGREKWLLDLVGLATLSDMVPLLGENRMLATFGLTVLRRTRRPGLSSLLKLLRIKREDLTEDDVGFMLAPRINAASRMEKPETAARLLATSDEEEGAELARTLNRINDERKGVVAATVKEIRRRLADSEPSGVIVMGNPNWRPGILGLAANSLAESEGKAVCLWGREGGDTIRGSCRSDGEVNVVSLMEGARDLFEDFGGHAFSGGFSMAQERVHELHGRLSAAYEGLKATAARAKEVVVDRELDLAEANPRTLRSLRMLAPFGEANTKPLLLFPRVELSEVRTFGKTLDHLQVRLTSPSTPLGVNGMAFFSGPGSFQKRAENGVRCDVVGHLETDWSGRPRVRVVDIL